MQSLFDKTIKALQTEIAALKADRIKAAQTLTVKEWTQSASIAIASWAPQKTIRIRITPTSATSPNILTAVSGSNGDHIFRTLRVMSGNTIIYYLTWIGHLDYSNDRADETITTTISVRYTAPATIVLDYVEPIYDF